MEQLPPCTCGANDWRGGGVAMGPGYQFYSRDCGACTNRLQYIGREGWWIVLILPPHLGSVLEDYANSTMVIQSRLYKAEWEPAAEAHQKALYEALCTEWGLDPAKGVVHHYLEGVKYTHTNPTTGRSIELTDFEYRDNEGNKLDIDAHAFHAACKNMWDANPQRPDIIRAPDPINIPEGVTAYVRRNGQWDLVVPATNSVDGLLGAEVLPPDPLRVRHDAYFAAVFQTVRENTGCPRFETREIPNGYYNDLLNSEPWFQFEVNGSTFTVGPRKRVINIEVTFAGSRPVEPLRDLAKADNVTYEANGRWQSDAEEATYITIHAWTQAKTVEYLSEAVRIALT